MTATRGAELDPPLEPADGAAVDRVDMLVVVGTDYHPFDRLIRWVDEWAAAQAVGYHAVVQHGSAAAPTVATGRALIRHDELQVLLAQAEVVVTHGGPASIIEARRTGRVPVVVPRSPAHGEHVDGHQIRFTRRLSELGLIALCETQEQFVDTLTRAAADPSHLAVERSSDLGGAADCSAGVEAVRQIVDDLIASRAAGRRRRVVPWRRSAR